MTTENSLKAVEELRLKQRHELSQPVAITNTLTDSAIGTLANITLEGMMIVCAEPLEANRIYQIELTLPEAIDGRDSVDLAIDCLWVKRDGNQDLSWAGCAIIDATDHAIEVIEVLIQQYAKHA